MRVYLAAAWSRRDEMREIATDLRSLGVEITSRWLIEAHAPPGGEERHMRENACIDLEDVRQSDCIVRFTDTLDTVSPIARHFVGDGHASWYVPHKYLSGARMVEMGYALALGKAVVVVGGKQNVFDRLPQVIHLKDVEELKRYLAPVEVKA